RSMSQVGAQVCHRHNCSVALAAGSSGDLDRSTRTATPFSEDDNWPACEEVGNVLRLYIIRVESRDFYVDSGEHWRIDVLAESPGRPFGLMGSGYDVGFAQPCVSDSLDQVSVHARANAEREEVRFVKLLANVVEHLAFCVDVAIGQQDDSAGN